MAFRIKPEDISEEAFYACDGDLLHDFGLGNADLARILNAAVEAGIVSPPCHVIKHDDGYVIDPGYERRIRVWPGKGNGPNCEHYWGQE